MRPCLLCCIRRGTSAARTVISSDAGSMSQRGSYAAVAAITVALVGVAGTAFVYLPHFSPAAVEARERGGKRPAPMNIGSGPGGGSAAAGAAAAAGASGDGGSGGGGGGSSVTGSGSGGGGDTRGDSGSPAAALPSSPAAVAAAARAAAVAAAAADMPFSAGLAADNAPGSMWRSISAKREVQQATSRRREEAVRLAELGGGAQRDGGRGPG